MPRFGEVQHCLGGAGGVTMDAPRHEDGEDAVAALHFPGDHIPVVGAAREDCEAVAKPGEPIDSRDGRRR